jgi:hypothetical protein
MRRILIFTVLLLILGTGYWYAQKPKAYRHYVSPDQKFSVTIYRDSRFFGLAGKSSDAPGTIVLRRSSDGEELQRMAIEMVQLVDNVNWETGRVEVFPVADWPLPE